MKTLITTLFALALICLQLGFQLFYQFNKISFHLFIVLEILCAAFFVCALLLLMPFLKRERRDKELKVLRPHFIKDILEASFNIIPSSREDRGQVYPNDPPKFSPEFAAHFPKEAAMWNDYCSNIETHNGKHREFVQGIKTIFESADLNVIDWRPQPKSPCIYEMIFDPLFWWWNSRSKHLGHLPVDFAKIEPNTSVQGNPYNLYVSGCNQFAIAYAESEMDRKKCQDAIISVAFNPKYEKGAADLIKSAEGIAKSINDLRSQLISKIQKIDTNWPQAGTYWSTKEYVFQRLNQCPKCRFLPK